MKKLLLIVISIFLVQSSFAQWSAMGTGPGGTVRALCVHNGELYAGGDFTGLVKKWNGSSWVAVGSLSGTSSPKVNALISYNGSLYAGGSFSSVQYNVAKLSGTTWVAVGSGLSGVAGSEVKVFYNFNGTLHAGGTFTQSGSASLSKIGKLSGTSWQQVGGGAPSKCLSGVYAMTAYNSQLYVGGQGSAPWINILNGTGSGWLELPAGGLTQGVAVYALSAFKYPNSSTVSLFVGGDFANTPSSTCCTYNTSTGWGTGVSVFSAGVADQINCFIASSSGSSGALYAGGKFNVSGIHASNNLAKKTITTPWDYENADVFNNTVNALCFYQGNIIAGGVFTAPGTNVAKFATTIGIDEVSDNIVLNTVYPNPVIKESLLRVQTVNELQQPQLRMLDLKGNEILAHTSRTTFNRSQNEVEFKIDREGLAAGIYYYMVLDEERMVATGKVIVE